MSGVTCSLCCNETNFVFSERLWPKLGFQQVDRSLGFALIFPGIGCVHGAVAHGAASCCPGRISSHSRHRLLLHHRGLPSIASPVWISAEHTSFLCGTEVWNDWEPFWTSVLALRRDLECEKGVSNEMDTISGTCTAIPSTNGNRKRSPKRASPWQKPNVCTLYWFICLIRYFIVAQFIFVWKTRSACCY